MQSDRQILTAIRKHQLEVKRLVATLEERHGLADTYDDEMWCFGMCIDGQGQVIDIDGSLKTLERYKKLAQPDSL